MLLINANQYNKNYFNQRCYNKSLNFTSKGINNFANSSYNELAKLRRNALMDIDNTDIKNIGELLKKRASSLPQTVDSMFYGIGMYLKGDTGISEFLDKYCSLTEPLYRRIATGTEKELYQESYAPELKMLVGIRDSINDLKANIIEQKELDSKIENFSRTYLKTPITRKKYFTE